MGKGVVVIASGETERRSLPHLVAHLKAEDIAVVEIRIPPGGRALNMEMAEKLLKASWFERIAAPPDKFVVLSTLTAELRMRSFAPSASSCQAESPRRSGRNCNLRAPNGISRPGTSPTIRGCEVTSSGI